MPIHLNCLKSLKNESTVQKLHSAFFMSKNKKEATAEEYTVVAF